MADIETGFVDQPRLLVDFGPTAYVDIGFDPAGLGSPDRLVRSLPALIDTGATESCIDSQLAAELSLPVVEQGEVAGVHGIEEVNFHLAQIHVPQLPFTIFGRFAGVHLRSGGQPHYALLGRTFLRHFTMVYRGRDGRVLVTDDESI